MCHDMAQPCGGCRGAVTACLLLLSLEIKSEPGPTAEGEVGGLISAPVLIEHKLPQRRFGNLVWVGEIRKSMSGIIRVFHLRIHSETAWRHLYTSHCILHGCTYCYKPFIVKRVSLLSKCCLQSLPFPAKPTQMPMCAGYRGLLMKAEQDITCGKLIRGIPKQ